MIAVRVGVGLERGDTSSKSSGLASGRAASWTSTSSVETCAIAFATDSERDGPP